jgi:hypothetical protein
MFNALELNRLILQQSTVRLATLMSFEFVSKTMHLWNGAGNVNVSGVEYIGIGTLGTISGLSQIREPTSKVVTVGLSGVNSDVIALAKNSVADVQGQNAYIWLQLFNDDLQTVGPKIPIFWGIMQKINIERTEERDGSAATKIAQLEIENPFYNRSSNTAGRFSDSDQQAKFPGDKFFRFVSNQKSQVVIWPNF